MSDAPETVESLCFHLRELADHAMLQIDADRLCRAAAEIAALQSRVADLEAANRGLVRLNEATEARAEAAEAALIRAKVGLVQARDELDQYSRQEYPLDHPVHERYRQRDYEANPARLALDALTLSADLAKRLGVSHE